MIHHDFPQGSVDWLRVRAGVCSASNFHKIVTPGGQISKQSAAYLHALLAEQILGRPLETIQTAYMERGQQLEDEAISAYEFHAGIETEHVGFLTNDEGTIGCSPDRLVNTVGLLEMKCPAPNTHVGYMLSREVDRDYYPQIQGQLLVTGREWVDWMSYHPEMPPVVVRVARDEKYIKTLELALGTFVETLQKARYDLEQRFGPFKRPEATDNGVELRSPKDFITDEDLEAVLAENRRRDGY